MGLERNLGKEVRNATVAQMHTFNGSFLPLSTRLVASALFAVTIATSSIAQDCEAPLSAIAPIPAESIQMGQKNFLVLPRVTLAYTQKYGTALNDNLTGITTDTLGNVYISGNSVNSDSSGFLRKYSPAGILLWSISKSMTSIDGVTLDKDGNAYITGSFVSGAWPTTLHYVYLEQYNSDGKVVWEKSIAAAPASDPTMMIANGIATDPSGSNFIIMLFERAFWPYQTRQVFIRKYNLSGVPIWEKPAGNSTPYTTRPILTIDNSGNTYTAINSAYSLQWNVFMSQFDTQGNPGWSTTFYSTASAIETYVHGITVESSGNVYVTGITKAGLEGSNFGYLDAFVRKYDNTGVPVWTRQFGTTATDYANSITSDAEGNVYVAGSSMGDLNGINRGNFDAIIRKYGSNGDVLQGRQFGTPEFDIASSVRIDAGGNLYVAGHTYGRLGGGKKGGQDIYFRKYSSFR